MQSCDTVLVVGKKRAPAAEPASVYRHTRSLDGAEAKEPKEGTYGCPKRITTTQTTTNDGVTRAMRALLLLAALLSLCALGCVVRAFCDYSLCCFSRGVKRAKLTSPRADFA